ncbi:MAG: CAP domain-containing protein [Terriglobales bacterium]
MRGGTTSWPGKAALLALLPALLAAGGTPERTLAPDPAAELELVERINQSRERSGLPKLEPNPRLSEAARAHALAMAARAQLTHRLPDEPELRLRVAATGLRFDFAGENVGRSSDAASMHEDFLLSPGHRENILRADANAVGVGAVRAGEDLFVTEDFAHLVPDYDSQQAEELVAQRIAELRKEARLAPLSRGAPGPLREEACSMAQRDRLEARRQTDPRLRGILQTIAYATADPARLPEMLREVMARKRPDSFSVGACSGRTPSYPSGAYWIVVVVYFSQ